MNKINEILSGLEVEPVTDINDKRTLFEYDEVVKAMRLYSNYKLDEAAEYARVKLHCGRSGCKMVVNKESILINKDPT